MNKAASEERSASPALQLIYMTRQGLDVQKNPIDHLINTFGFVCEHNALSPPQCRFELELTKFLKSFPTLEALVHDVTALGASCERSIGRWDCKYERRVEQKNWKSGDHEPISIADEHFRIVFSVISQGGALSYQARLNRKTEMKKPRAPH